MQAAQAAATTEATPVDPQIESLKYINRLATMSGTPTVGWNLLEVFNDGQGKLITEHAEINKRFFERKATLPKVDNSAALAFYQKNIEMVDKTAVAGMIQQCEIAIEGHRHQIQDYSRGIENETQRWGQQVEKLQALQGGGTSRNIEVELRKILEKGFWKLWTVRTDGVIEFVTASEVVMEHKNLKAKVDLQANFGKLKAQLSIPGRNIYVQQHFNNIHCAGDSRRFHPHVYGDARVCWGSAAELLAEAMANLRFADAMELLTTILTHYNPDSPVTSFNSFDPNRRFNTPEPVSAWERPKPTPEQQADPVHLDAHCDECDRHIDDCECEPL
jgi:hypothetical protein